MSDNVFHQFRARGEPDEPDEYEAIDMAVQRQLRMRFVQPDGTLFILSYTYLMEVICTSHQYVSLIFSNCIVTLGGRNLHDILDGLQDEKIRAFHCYRESDGVELDETAPLITSMIRESLQEVMGEAMNTQDAASIHR